MGTLPPELTAEPDKCIGIELYSYLEEMNEIPIFKVKFYIGRSFLKYQSNSAILAHSSLTGLAIELRQLIKPRADS